MADTVIQKILASGLQPTRGRVMRKNLIKNPSYEVDTSNTLTLASSVALDTTTFPGKSVCKVTPAGNLNRAGIISANVEREQGSYTHSFDLAVPTDSLYNFFEVLFYDSVAATARLTFALNPLQKTGEFVRYSVTTSDIEPFDRVYIQVRIDASTIVPSSEIYHVDNILLEKSKNVGEFFDGDSDYARWTGTEHASASELLSCSAQDLLHDYWANLSGLTPVDSYSVADHCEAADATDPIKDVHQFFDNFNDGELTGWTIDIGGWSAASGALKVTIDSTNLIGYDADLPDDQYAEIDTVVLASQLGASICLRATDSSNFYMGRYNKASNLYQIYVNVAGVFTLAASSSAVLPADETYHLRFEAEGQNLRLLVNGAKVLEYFDAANSHPTGKVKLRNTTIASYIDNFRAGGI